jgi:hypothetical protein
LGKFEFETFSFCDPIAMQLKLFFHTSSNNHLLISASDENFNHSKLKTHRTFAITLTHSCFRYIVLHSI